LNLPQEVLALLRDGSLSAGHGRALAGVDGKNRQIALANAAVKEGWSVRELERWVKQPAPEPAPKKEKPKLLPELYDFEEKLREKFATKVRLTGNEKRGRITIEYFSPEDLERIYEILGQ